jgi:hypothetical protein
MDELAPYAELRVMAEREHQLISAGAWDELVELGIERAALAARLPSAAPVRARELLQETHMMVSDNVTALTEARRQTGEQLGALRRARSGWRSYAQAEPRRRFDALS